jgi:hypothetical protein
VILSYTEKNCCEQSSMEESSACTSEVMSAGSKSCRKVICGVRVKVRYGTVVELLLMPADAFAHLNSLSLPDTHQIDKLLPFFLAYIAMIPSLLYCCHSDLYEHSRATHFTSWLRLWFDRAQCFRIVLSIDATTTSERQIGAEVQMGFT